MDDDDEFGDDDFFLDEATLAVLEEEEQKHLSVEPPVKRRKLENGEVSTRTSLEFVPVHPEEDEMPDISVDELPQPPTYQSFAGRPRIFLSQEEYPPPRAPATTTTTKSNSVGLAVAEVSSAPSRRVNQSNTRAASHAPSGVGRNSSVPSRSVHPTNQASSSTRHPSQGYRPNVRPMSHPVPPASKPNVADTVNSNAPEAVQALMLQLEELRKQNAEIQRAFREALDVRHAKEGEVTILRKGMEKTAQEHSAQVARLKAAKDEADGKQLQMQREMREEVERLKTQFIFKQQEIESSSRKPPLSTRSKRTLKDSYMGPLATPSQPRGWSQATSNGAGPSHETPIRPKRSPKINRTITSPELSRRPAMLPGFQNAFTDSIPLREKLKSSKGKEKAEPRPSQQERRRPPSSQFVELDHFPSSSPPRPSYQDQNDDVIMDDVADVVDPVPPEIPPSPSTNVDQNAGPGDADVEMEPTVEEPLDDLEPFDWTAELLRIILTHASPSPEVPTFQSLMSIPFLDAAAASAHTYSSELARILELLAGTSKYQYVYLVGMIGRCLLTMAGILNRTGQIPPLISMLNLLTLLSSSLPQFTYSLMSHPDPDSDGNPFALVVLCGIVRDQLTPPTASNTLSTASKGSEHTQSLGHETLNLLEALCWNLSEEHVERFSYIPEQKDVIAILLHESQPSWLLARSVKFVLLLSTYHGLHRSLLSTPVPNADGPAPADRSKIPLPLIDQLCRLFIEVDRQDPEFLSMKSYILVIWAMLSVSPAETFAILADSNLLIPSLVVYMTQLATPLWEDHDLFASPPEDVLSTIRTLNQCLFLLHHLVYGTEPPLNLRQKLHYAPHRLFNGVVHMLIVTLGRLSFAEAPEWVNQDGKAELERMIETARDLLDLVVGGPDNDSVWVAYNDNSDQANEIDEGEMEKQLLGDEDEETL